MKDTKLQKFLEKFLEKNDAIRKILPFVIIFVITGLITIAFFSNLYLAYSSRNYVQKPLVLSKAIIPDLSSYNERTGEKNNREQAQIIGNSISIPNSGADVILSGCLLYTSPSPRD